MTNEQQQLVEDILGKHLQNHAIDMLKINITDLSAEIISAIQPSVSVKFCAACDKEINESCGIEECCPTQPKVRDVTKVWNEGFDEGVKAASVSVNEGMFEHVRKEKELLCVVAENESYIIAFGKVEHPHTENELRAFTEFLNIRQSQSLELRELIDEASSTAKHLELKDLKYSACVVRRLCAKVKELTNNKENKNDNA